MYSGAGQGGGRGGGDDAALMAALMAAAAQEEAQKSKAKYMEAALPVALLIILALIFAVKMGFIDLSVIPGFSQPVSVMILTDNPSDPAIQNTIQVLQSESSYYKIKTRTMTLTPNKRIFAQQFADTDVIILYETDPKPTLSKEQRLELQKYLKAGGKMIVILNSGTYIPQCDILGTGCDPSAREWVGWLYLSDFMPVECDNEEACVPESIDDSVLYTIDPDNPIMKGFEQIELPSPTAIKRLQLSKTGTDVADIYEGGIDNPKAVYLGITVSQNIFGGKVVHFNFEPWKIKYVLVNTVLYLSGKSIGG